MVTFLIPCNLGGPEISVGLWNSVILAALVAMPEAAVDEDYGVVLGENNVGFTWQALVIHPVAKAVVPKGVAEFQLRLGRGGVNGGHGAAANVGSQYVRH